MSCLLITRVRWIAGDSWKSTLKKLILFAAFPLSFISQAQDKTSNNEFSPLYEKLWKNPAIEQRITKGIETNRMGFAAFRFVDAKGSPLTKVEINLEQTRHDFLFGANIFMLGGFPTHEQNSQFETAFTSILNYATVPFYWSDLEPEQGVATQ